MNVASQPNLIQQAREYPATIVSPYVRFDFAHDFSLDCVFIYTNPSRYPNDKGGKSCNQYLSQPKIIDSPNVHTGFYTGNVPFSGQGTLGLHLIDIRILVNEQITYDDPKSGYLNLNLYDPDPEYSKVELKDTNTLNSRFIGPQHIQFIRFMRFRNETILRNDWHNVLGVPPARTDKNHYMIANFETLPFVAVNNSAKNLYARMEIGLMSTELSVIKERSNSTILGMLSALGGAFTIGAGIYTLCFGIELKTPWGIAQRIPGIKGTVRKTLNQEFGLHIPFAKRSPIGKTIKMMGSTEERIAFLEHYNNTLEERQNNLELFLKDYIVDVRYLENIKEPEEEKEEKLGTL
ncbi:hypothetical protein G9A89_019640 [Geosiphon pyriformis]|nr:hypothetical protein G9A89_019640 [Geosiphon pyriformis]